MSGGNFDRGKGKASIWNKQENNHKKCFVIQKK
jgi:hypothetical protein